MWVVGFDLNPAPERGCFCSKGTVAIWKRSEIEERLRENYRLEATSNILYEDAAKLINLGKRMYLSSEEGSVCYDAFWRNCGSFALQLLRKASIPAPHIGSYCNAIFPLCPPWTCSINSTVRKAKIGANNYKKEHLLRRREGKEGLSLCTRGLRVFVFGYDT